MKNIFKILIPALALSLAGCMSTGLSPSFDAANQNQVSALITKEVDEFRGTTKIKAPWINSNGWGARRSHFLRATQLSTSGANVYARILYSSRVEVF